MKRKLRGFLQVVCMMIAVLALTACGSKADTAEAGVDETTAATYKSAAESLISQISAFTDEEIASYIEQGEAFTTGALESWTNAKDDLGAYQSMIDQSVAADDNIVTVTSNAQFEKATASVELIMDTDAQAYTSLTFNVNYTFGQKMEKAGLNTVMGICIVFVMLVFLSFLISLMKFIPKLLNKKTAPAITEAPAAAAVPAEVVEEELVDDGELVAVIAAAIAASENTSTDSFVVRSIKKSNKWRRA